MSASRFAIAALLLVGASFGTWGALRREETIRRREAEVDEARLASANAEKATQAQKPRAKPETDAAPTDDAETKPPTKPGKLTVRVVADEYGSPIAGADVRAHEGYRLDSPFTGAVTDETGDVRITIEKGLDDLGMVLVSAAGRAREASNYTRFDD